MKVRRYIVVAAGSWVAGAFDSEAKARRRAALYGGEARVYRLAPPATSALEPLDFIGAAGRPAETVTG